RLFAVGIDVVGLAVDRDRLALEGKLPCVAGAMTGYDGPVPRLGRSGAETGALRHDRRRQVDLPGSLIVPQFQMHVRIAEADRLDCARDPAFLLLRPGPAVVRGDGRGQGKRDGHDASASYNSHGVLLSPWSRPVSGRRHSIFKGACRVRAAG